MADLLASSGDVEVGRGPSLPPQIQHQIEHGSGHIHRDRGLPPGQQVQPDDTGMTLCDVVRLSTGVAPLRGLLSRSPEVSDVVAAEEWCGGLVGRLPLVPKGGQHMLDPLCLGQGHAQESLRLCSLRRV